MARHITSLFFFFNDTATTEIYTLSLHDALPISAAMLSVDQREAVGADPRHAFVRRRSEEHTSELQSPVHLVCRLLLEKKKQTNNNGYGPISRTYSWSGYPSSLLSCCCARHYDSS